MRIRVTTSINVRSSPLLSAGPLDNGARPEKQWDNRMILRSPDCRMRSFAPHQDSATSCFVASQPRRKPSRLSALLNGFSGVNNDRRNDPGHDRKTSRNGTHRPTHSRHPIDHHAPRLRPRESTLSLIDPAHSPCNGTRTAATGGHEVQLNPYNSTRDAYQTRLRAYMGHPPETNVHKRRHRKRSHRRHQESTRTCFPHVHDKRTRQKIFGCLFFGAVLAIVLTICTLSTT